MLNQLIQLGKRHGLSLLLWLAIASPATALELRVAIEDGVSQVKVASSTKAVVRDGSGQKLGELSGMNAFIAQPTGGGIALDRWRTGQIWIEHSRQLV